MVDRIKKFLALFVVPVVLLGPVLTVSAQTPEPPPPIENGEDLPPISDVIDETTSFLDILLSRSELPFMVIAFLILAVQKWIFPNTQFKVETAYRWVVGIGTIIYVGALTLGYGDVLNNLLTIAQEPLEAFWDLLLILLGPAGLFAVAKALHVPFFGSSQGNEAMSVQRE